MILPLPSLFCVAVRLAGSLGRGRVTHIVGEGMAWGFIFTLLSLLFPLCLFVLHEEVRSKSSQVTSPSQSRIETLLFSAMISVGGNRMQHGDHVGERI